MDISIVIGYFFAAIIILYFLFCIFKVNSQNPKHIILVDNATISLSSIGILGTFLGIFLGLKDFNINEIDKSVPSLIEGLKFAFFSSIFKISDVLHDARHSSAQHIFLKCTIFQPP